MTFRAAASTDFASRFRSRRLNHGVLCLAFKIPALPISGLAKNHGSRNAACLQAAVFAVKSEEGYRKKR